MLFFFSSKVRTRVKLWGSPRGNTFLQGSVSEVARPSLVFQCWWGHRPQHPTPAITHHHHPKATASTSQPLLGSVHLSPQRLFLSLTPKAPWDGCSHGRDHRNHSQWDVPNSPAACSALEILAPGSALLLPRFRTSGFPSHRSGAGPRCGEQARATGPLCSPWGTKGQGWGGHQGAPMGAPLEPVTWLLGPPPC